MAKATNYTAEMEATLREGYDPKASVEDRNEAVARLADQIGRSVASVRQKLVRMELYVRPEKTAKDGSPIVSKGDLVAEIADACGVPPEEFDSLEKATKRVLNVLVEKLTSE